MYEKIEQIYTTFSQHKTVKSNNIFGEDQMILTIDIFVFALFFF